MFVAERAHFKGWTLRCVHSCCLFTPVKRRTGVISWTTCEPKDNKTENQIFAFVVLWRVFDGIAQASKFIIHKCLQVKQITLKMSLWTDSLLLLRCWEEISVGCCSDRRSQLPPAHEWDNCRLVQGVWAQGLASSCRLPNVAVSY